MRAVVGLFAATLLAACVRANLEPPPLPPKEVWVDERAPSDGDGSPSAPLKALPARLEGPGRWRLAPGFYQGPILLVGGAVLETSTQAVITAAEGAVVTSEGGALIGVSLQGGATGLVVRGPTSVERARVSGASEEAVRVEAGELTGGALVLVGTRGQAKGLVVRGGRVALAGLKLEGTLTHGVDNHGGEVRLQKLESQGGGFGLRAVGGATTIDSARFIGGRAAAMFVGGGGRLAASDVEIFGHAEALEVGVGAAATVTRLKSQRTTSAGVTVVRGRLELTDSELVETGPQGALVVLSGELEARHVVVKRAKAMAVLVRQGTLSLRKCRIEGVSKESNGDGTSALGDAVMAREASVTLEELTVRDVEGSAVFATAMAKVSGTSVIVQRAGGGAVLAERGAALKLEVLRVEGGPEAAVTALEGGLVELEHLDAPPSMPAVWAECGQGARVVLGRAEGATTGLTSPCVSVVGAKK